MVAAAAAATVTATVLSLALRSGVGIIVVVIKKSKRKRKEAPIDLRLCVSSLKDREFYIGGVIIYKISLHTDESFHFLVLFCFPFPLSSDWTDPLTGGFPACPE
jgi:hypothetical protein